MYLAQSRSQLCVNRSILLVVRSKAIVNVFNVITNSLRQCFDPPIMAFQPNNGFGINISMW